MTSKTKAMNTLSSTIPTKTGIIINGFRYEINSLDYSIHPGNCPKYINQQCPHEILFSINQVDGQKILELGHQPFDLIIKGISIQHKFNIRKIQEVRVTMDEYKMRLTGLLIHPSDVLVKE